MCFMIKVVKDFEQELANSEASWLRTLLAPFAELKWDKDTYWLI